MVCAILRRYPQPALLNLPAIGYEIQNPFQAKIGHSTVSVRSTDGRPIGRRHIVEGLTLVVIDQKGTIRCAHTGRVLWITSGSPIDRANPGAAEALNPTYRPTLHQAVADHR